MRNVFLAAIIVLLAAVGLFLMAISLSDAADTRYVWTNPPFQVKADSCAETDTIPETGLSHARMALIRVDEPDTLDLGQKPLSGAGVQDSVAVSTVDRVWLHIFQIRNFDNAGNGACITTSYLRAIPVTEWPPPAPPPGPPGLAASYFDHPDFTGARADVIDALLDFPAGAWPTHNTGPAQFSVRWDGFVTVAGAGFYNFRAQVSGAVRLWVDGRAVIDDWVISGDRAVGGEIGLVPGAKAFRAEYRNTVPGASLRLFWTPPGGSEVLVPAGVLGH